MIATFNGNPKTNAISCCNCANQCEEDDVQDFYYKLTSIVHQAPKHNVMILGEDMNAKLGLFVRFLYTIHDTANRNRLYLLDFLFENNLVAVNT